MSLANLRAAARLAREASLGRRTIEIKLTGEGITVRGWTTTGERRHNAYRCIAWPELSSPADLASEAVASVDRGLSAMEGRA